MVKKIARSDGTIENFEVDKIADAIFKTAEKVGGSDREKSIQLAMKVDELLNEKFPDAETVKSESVHDAIERILVKNGHARTAKAYILDRRTKEEAEKKEIMVDATKIIDEYVGNIDWEVKENANKQYSLGGLNIHIVSKLISRYWLDKVYDEDVKKVHREGDLHIHDLRGLCAYCCGWDVKDVLLKGFSGVRGKIHCNPPKHFETALGQMVNYIYTLQHETAGAQAFSSVDTYLAPFIRYDGLIQKEIKQALQVFMFNMNVPTRVGFETPFTNITLDLTCPSHMKDESIIIGGQLQKETYGEFQKEMDMFNKALADVFMEGDGQGRLFTFPIPTYNIYRGLDWNTEVMDKIMEMTAKFGLPYFANFINSDMKPEDARSMCCRLRLDNRELKKRGGGLFGSNPLTGSQGVVTINLARIGFLSKTNEQFYERLENLMNLARKSLRSKRKYLEKFTRLGLYPYAKAYMNIVFKAHGEYWKNHFSTIGILGMNEALLNFMQKNIASKEGKQFAIEVLDFMRDKLVEWQEEDGDMYNLEATPAEGTTRRFAQMDKKKYPEIIVANEKAYQNGAAPYYTNSTHLPVGYTDDIFEALELQDELQSRYTGGTVLHGFIGESLPSKEVTRKIVKKIAENFKLPYFTLTPTFSSCQEHGYLSGAHKVCPKCKEEGKETKCEIFSRVVGYVRPVEHWNDAKQAEFEDRKTYDNVLSMSD